MATHYEKPPDAARRWLSYPKQSAGMTQTRTINAMNDSSLRSGSATWLRVTDAAIAAKQCLTYTGRAGKVVVEGHVNEPSRRFWRPDRQTEHPVWGAAPRVRVEHPSQLSEVNVNGQPATLQTDPVAGGYRFRRPVDVTAGSNTVTVAATDRDEPPNTTTQVWSFNVPTAQRTFTYNANGNHPSRRSGSTKWLRLEEAAFAAKQFTTESAGRVLT